MKHVYELLEAVDDPKIFARLQTFLERRAAAKTPGADADDVVPDHQAPPEAARFAVGNAFGKHRETIIRREIRRDLIPAWFDPREHPGQFGFISPNGLRVYIEVKPNVESRNKPSTFDERLLTLVVRNPEPLSLFGEAEPEAPARSISAEPVVAVPAPRPLTLALARAPAPDPEMPPVPETSEQTPDVLAAQATERPSNVIAFGPTVPGELPVEPDALFAVIRGEKRFDFTTLDAAAAPVFRNMLLDMKRDATRALDQLMINLELEFERRLKRIDGAIPTVYGAIKLKDTWTPYSYDLDKLRAAQQLLPKDEAKKLIDYVPEEVIPAHADGGNPISINAIKNRYPESKVAELLEAGMHRSKTGSKVVWPKVPNIIGGSVETIEHDPLDADDDADPALRPAHADARADAPPPAGTPGEVAGGEAAHAA